jgi:predicted nucleic acid-binding protein
VVILDSSVLIDLFAARVTPQTTWVRQQSHFQRMGITTLILCEVLRGFRDHASVDKAAKALAKMHIFESIEQELAEETAANFRHLRSLGIPVRGTIDCLTATFCIRQGHRLLHNDRDFDAFQQHLNLRVVYPAEPQRP